MNLRAYGTKATLKAELKFIPAVAWAVAGLVLLLWMAVAVPYLVQFEQAKAGGAKLPLWALQALLTFAGVILAIWVLMVFYVNADASRRQMNRLLWTLVVIFVPNAIGFIVYFLLRQPIAQPCPKCGTGVKPDFVYCPACGHALAPTCPGCHHPVEGGWTRCAFCGAELGG